MAVATSAGGWGRTTKRAKGHGNGRKPKCNQSRRACSVSCTRTNTHKERHIPSRDTTTHNNATAKRNPTAVTVASTEKGETSRDSPSPFTLTLRDMNIFKSGDSTTTAARACALVAATTLCGSMTSSLSTQHAIAAEYDILGTPTPVEGSYIVDDAKVLSKASESVLKKSLSSLETDTGYHIDIVTTRKLTFSADAYEFADKTIEKWYPTKELGDKKALLLLVTGSKEGAVVGGPSFIKGAGPIGDSIAGESIPFYGDKELWNEAVLSSAKRLDVVLRGGDDPGPPKSDAGKGGRSYKTKEETDAKKTNFSAAVIGLLVISVVAPMLQYFAYVKDD